MHGFALRATNIQVEQQLKKSLITGIVAFNPLLVISTAVSQLQLSLQRVEINCSKTVVLLQKYLANIGTQLPHEIT